MSLDNEAGGMTGLSIFFNGLGMTSVLLPMVRIFDAWRGGTKLVFVVEDEKQRLQLTIRPLRGDGRRTKDVAVDVSSWDTDEGAFAHSPELTERCNAAIKEGIAFLPGNGEAWLVVGEGDSHE